MDTVVNKDVTIVNIGKTNNNMVDTIESKNANLVPGPDKIKLGTKHPCVNLIGEDVVVVGKDVAVTGASVKVNGKDLAVSGDVVCLVLLVENSTVTGWKVASGLPNGTMLDGDSLIAATGGGKLSTLTGDVVNVWGTLLTVSGDGVMAHNDGINA